jgi:hypothetical protein
MEVYDANTEQVIVSKAILTKDDDFLAKDHIEKVLPKKKKKSLSDIIGASSNTKAIEDADCVEPQVSLFKSDADFYAELFEYLKTAGKIHDTDVNIADGGKYLEILDTPQLDHALRGVPAEAKPGQGEYFRLTTDKDTVKKAIAETRNKTEKKEQNKWTKFQILYELHPVIRYFFQSPRQLRRQGRGTGRPSRLTSRRHRMVCIPRQQGQRPRPAGHQRDICRWR